MDRQSLERFLNDEGIDADAYNVNGDRSNEKYVLARRGSGWVVYYAERGLETGIQHFDS